MLSLDELEAVVDVLLLRLLGFPPTLLDAFPATRRFETSYQTEEISMNMMVSE